MGTSEDWAYKTTPQEGACRAYKAKGCAWPRGKALGGSSSINLMFYVRGNKADYDEWAADGNTGWGFEDVLPYFKKSENFLGADTTESRKYHGRGGYLSVSYDTNVHKFEDMLMRANVEIGIKNLTDVNADSQMGVMKSLTTTVNGTRFSTARAFLRPIKDRKNFHVIKNALATKILFKPGTNIVSGVMLNKNGQNIVVNVKKEVIVSAGAINSPQLLLLSGIGPKEHLEDMNIDVVADLPVGENLQDHLFVPTLYTGPKEPSMTLTNIVETVYNHIMYNKGPLMDTSPQRIIAFVNTTNPSSPKSDMQYHYLIFPPGFIKMMDMFQKHGLSDEASKQFRDINEKQYTMFIYNTLLKPKSAGRLMLKSKNPFEHPLLYADYFKDPEDLRIVIESFKQHTLRYGDTKAFKEHGFKLDWIELEACKQYDKNTDDFLECYSRELTFSLYHPTSTCKMGPDGDKTAVVDTELKVRNVQGLRVIDASIMPSVVRGNTNAPSIMIGEKGADMIKKYWLPIHTEL